MSADENQEPLHTPCTLCNGLLVFLGVLGNITWLRCRQSGDVQVAPPGWY